MKLKETILIILIGFVSFNLNAQKVTKYFEKGKYDKAEEYCSEQEGDFQKQCYTELADLYFGVKNYDKASIFYEKSNSFKEGFAKIGDVYFADKDFVKAFDFYSKVDYDEGIIKIGDYYFNEKKYDEALTYYKEANYSAGISKIGDIYFDKTEINTAQKYYELAFENDKLLLNEKYLKIANFYFNNSNLDTAKTYYELCYSTDKKNLSNSYKKIGDEYFNSEEYTKAVEYYEKAFIDDKSTLNTYYEKIANIYFDKFYFEEAKLLYSKANLTQKVKECDNLISSHEFIDVRDNKTYSWVKIGNQIWMAENLAYKPDNGTFWAYENNEENVSIYGYLYDFETAKNVCPDGWHLSTDNDWLILLEYLGMSEFERNQIGHFAPGVGTKLKSTTLWKLKDDVPIGTNEIGFNALPAGSFDEYRNEFWALNQRCFFWSPNKSGEQSFTRELFYYNAKIGMFHAYSKKGGFSVRCVKD